MLTDLTAFDDNHAHNLVSTQIAKGITLTQLLAKVSQAIEKNFAQPEWVKLEVSGIKIHSGHLYFNAVDRDQQGKELSKSNAIIWNRTREKIINKFLQATGAQFENGLKALVLAQGV